MRYKDVSKPLYEAVRYGNKEKSYVLSNLNKFNFGVELEFDLPKANDNIKILNPKEAVRGCLIKETNGIGPNVRPILQEYPDYTVSQMCGEIRDLLIITQSIKKSDTDNMYDVTPIKDKYPDFIHYIVAAIVNILYDKYNILNLFLSVLFPVSPIKDNMSVEFNDEFIEHIDYICITYPTVDSTFKTPKVSQLVYERVIRFITEIQSFLGLLSELPIDPKLEEIKRGKSFEERREAVIDYTSEKLAVVIPNTEEVPVVIYPWISPFIPNLTIITSYLKELAEESPDVIKIIPSNNIGLANAKESRDISHLNTKFDIVPEGTNQIEFISPICTGEEITQCFSDMKKLTDIVISKNGTTSNKTGLHLSISYKGATSSFNALKFLLFSDSYRQIVKPEHVRNYVQSISDDLFNLSINNIISDIMSNRRLLDDTIIRIENLLSKKKYMSVNLGVMDSSNGRVELRWPGGNGYEHRLDAYADSAIRAMYALEIAYNPAAFRKEYLLSFFRVIDSLFKERLNCDLLRFVGLIKRIDELNSGIYIFWGDDDIHFVLSHSSYKVRDFSDLMAVEQQILDIIEREYQ